MLDDWACATCNDDLHDVNSTDDPVLVSAVMQRAANAEHVVQSFHLLQQHTTLTV